MLTIIATIKPVHLGNIRSGVKNQEMRKSLPKSVPFRVLCCQSRSGGKILAEFVVRSPLKVYPASLPAIVEEACVTMQEAEAYAAGKELWFWDINDMIDYCSTEGYRVRNVSEFGLKRPPQSWCYVEESQKVNKRPCLTCTRVNDPANCDNKNCTAWRDWFVKRWEELRHGK